MRESSLYEICNVTILETNHAINNYGNYDKVAISFVYIISCAFRGHFLRFIMKKPLVKRPSLFEILCLPTMTCGFVSKVKY